MGEIPICDFASTLFRGSPQQHSAAMGTMGCNRQGWEQPPCPEKCRRLHPQTKKTRHKICLVRFLSCPRDPLSVLKPFLEAQLCITFRFISEFVGHKTNSRDVFHVRRQQGERGPNWREYRKSYAKRGVFSPKQTWKYCQVAIHSYFK